MYSPLRDLIWPKSQPRDEVVEEAKPFINDGISSKDVWSSRTARICKISPIVAWQLVSACLAALSLFLFFRAPQSSSGGFEHGFPTDLAAATSTLSTHKIMFDGGPSFHDNGTEYLRPFKGKKYLGGPSQEIDDNWTELTENRWFRLTEDEARAAWGNECKKFWNEFAGGYLATIDVMHLLHCLDHIRKAFHPEYYAKESSNGIHGDLHRDHCIDGLRQMLMCNADITPLPTRWYPSTQVGVGIHYVDSDRPHTCRNWQAVRDFVSSRSIGPDMVMPHHSPEHESDWEHF